MRKSLAARIVRELRVGAMITPELAESACGLPHMDEAKSDGWLPGKVWVRILEAAAYGDQRKWKAFADLCIAKRGHGILVPEAIDWVRQKMAW